MSCGVLRLFAAIKRDLLSFCSGTGNLPDDCSGWALLQHMLPLHPDIQRRRMIHNAPCACDINLSLSTTIFEEPVSKLWSTFFPSLQQLACAQSEPNTESSTAMRLACTAALASHTLQDQVNELPAVRVAVVASGVAGLGMRAAVSGDDAFTAREEEKDAIIATVRSVMDGTSHESRRVLLLHGVPGLGKSLLATQALRSAQNELVTDAVKARANQDVRLEIVRGRGAGVMEEDLVALGRNLGSVIGVVSASPADVVLAALRRFFSTSRYVLLIDDADEEGLARGLEFLPESNQRSALIITSQSLKCDSVTKLLAAAGNHTALHFHKELNPFTHEECMKLMTRVCVKCEALLKQEDDLRALFAEGLGCLPLAVRLFAEWSRRQYNASMREHADDMRAKMQAACKSAREAADKVKQPYDQEQAEAQFRLDYDATTGRCTSAANAVLQLWRSKQEDIVLHADATYSRGLLGTVRLALLQLDALPADLKEGSKQLLGLLALCPPVQVPWSLFDGVSHVSAAGQACRVRREDGTDCAIDEDALVASDAAKGDDVVVEFRDGQEMSVGRFRVEFGPHIIGMVVKDDRYQVQLVTPQPYMRGARVELHGFVKEAATNGRQGRVVQHHEDGSVSVVFGCDTGECCPPAAAECLHFVFCVTPVYRLSERAEAWSGSEAGRSGQRASAGRGRLGCVCAGGGGAEASCCCAAGQWAGAGGRGEAHVRHASAAAAGGGYGAGLA